EQLTALGDQEAQARAASEELSDRLAAALERVQSLRSEQLIVEKALETARAERERARAELTSLEALQKAALTHEAGGAAEWLEGAGLGSRPRVTETLEVDSGWERAVETALGDYLEAVCVDHIDSLSDTLAGLAKGRVMLIESAAAANDPASETLAAKVDGPAAVIAH